VTGAREQRLDIVRNNIGQFMHRIPSILCGHLRRAIRKMTDAAQRASCPDPCNNTTPFHAPEFSTFPVQNPPAKSIAAGTVLGWRTNPSRAWHVVSVISKISFSKNFTVGSPLPPFSSGSMRYHSRQPVHIARQD